MTRVSTRWIAVAVAACAAGGFSLGARANQDEASALHMVAAPAHGIWVDSLDLSRVPLRRPRGGGPGRAGQPAPATPPPPPVYALGGVAYPHAVPLESDRDFAIDLKGQATRFTSMVGIDSAVQAGRGSVIFGVWVDGRKVADSGVMRGGEAPKILTANLKGATRLTLGVIDGNDGTGGDSANWGGALITMTPGATQRPEVLAPAVEAMPPIASSRSSLPLLNYPRITGATPGKPFMFMIPASGEEPLMFAAKNLPAGLQLDARTGLITGSLKAAGRTPVEITVSNAKGRTTGTLTIVGGDNALALTPPLGWNSWNAWGNTVTAERVRASAHGMVASGLHRQGYTYINIDDLWEVRPAAATGVTGRDANGEILTNERFPDMKGLVDEIHGLGLKAGIYSSPGPTTCQGVTATYEHEAQDARTFAKWGFDYLKYDWCSYSRIAPNPTLEDRKKPYKLMGDILKTLDRDMIFSICQYGAGNVWEWGKEMGGHLWRMTGDIRDNWPSMTGIGFQQTGREQFAGPGGWNDTDMLVVGMVGWSQGQRPSDLTPNEQLTHMALWALQAAPLLIGADLSKIDEWTTNVLGNREMLAVNQDPLGKPAGRKTSDGWVEVWARPLENGTIAAGLFNRGPEAATVTATWTDLGLTGPQPVRDVWLQKDLGRMNDRISAVVPRHGVLFVQIGTPRPGGQRQAQGAGQRVFVGATALDGTGAAIPNAVVVVRDGRIEAIGPAGKTLRPAGAPSVDLTGKFLMPGLISAHAHVSDVQGLGPRAYTDDNTLRQLGVFARYGVTSVWSLGGEQAPAFRARDSQAVPTTDRARIFLSGDIITGATPEAARAMVVKVAATKPDVIKIRVDDNLGAAQKMKPEVYRAIIDEAHRHKLRVAAHIFYLDDAKDLLRAGVDMIAHSVRDKDIDAEFISLMKARDVPYCPTLTRELSTFVYESTPAFFSDPFFLKEADPAVVAQLQEPARQAAMQKSASAQAYKAALVVAQRNLKKAVDAGIVVVMGTDTGPFPERYQGYFEHVELEMMVAAGLTPAQALKSATGDAARGLKMTGLGTLAPGNWADMVAVDRDPRTDIKNTRTISGVWVAGNAVKR